MSRPRLITYIIVIHYATLDYHLMCPKIMKFVFWSSFRLSSDIFANLIATVGFSCKYKCMGRHCRNVNDNKNTIKNVSDAQNGMKRALN